MTPLLTVIIPFRNEGEEVYNTINSIVENAESNISIILINDNSNDNYDYQKVAEAFNVNYIINKSNMGVAASREIGVSLCKTKYFLFLDAHMRSFTKGWDILLVNELDKDNRAVFCTATIGLNNMGEPILLNQRGCGVTLNLSDLSYIWNADNITESLSVYQIPCVMGASYSSNISYWKKLRGLEGLNGYGYDEQLISIKTFLEGGSCKVIRNIEFGHIFRQVKDVPYTINNVDVIFNQLYITELFYPKELKPKYFRTIKSLNEAELFNQAMKKLSSMRDKLAFLKNYYNSIFTKKFDEFLKLNDYANTI